MIMTKLPTLGVSIKPNGGAHTFASDPDWMPAKKLGDAQAAYRFAQRHWTPKLTDAFKEQLDHSANLLFISQPSTSGVNVLPTGLAETLAMVHGGRFLDGERHFRAYHLTESKNIPPERRVLHRRDYELRDPERLRVLTCGKIVVVVDDIFTSGGSAGQLIRTLQEAGISVQAVVGYVGDTRLNPDPQTISALQNAIRHTHMNIKGKDLAALLTRAEVRGLTRLIHDARTSESIQTIARDLQGLLFGGVDPGVGTDPQPPGGTP
ncbi:MAG: phosphoribosyltransferase [Magnetococcales bacterium]|nr:phosphoribosyltransferase [Magnetococcales bacterium]